MGWFWLVALPSIITPFVAKYLFDQEISWLEVAAGLVVCLLITFGVYQSGRYSKLYYTEIWNGEVTNKQRNEVSCSHSYSCNCTPTYDDKGNYTGQSCQTCYEHDYDVDWDVYSNTERNYSIPSPSRQGLVMPERWAAT